MPYTLRPIQREAARLIAEGEVAGKVQERLKLKPATLGRWRRIPAFTAAVERYAREMEEAFAFKLRAMRYASACRLHRSTTQSWRDASAAELSQMVKLLHIEEQFPAVASHYSRELEKDGLVGVVLQSVEDNLALAESLRKASKLRETTSKPSETASKPLETAPKPSETVRNCSVPDPQRPEKPQYYPLEEQ